MKKRILFISLACSIMATACGKNDSIEGSNNSKINVVFSKVGFDATIEDIKNVYGECNPEDISTGSDGHFEYKYECDYLGKDALVGFGFDSDEKLIIIRWNYHGDPSDVAGAYEALYNDVVAEYGNPEQEQSGEIAMWSEPNIMITNMKVFTNSILDCTFYSPEYAESINNDSNE